MTAWGTPQTPQGGGVFTTFIEGEQTVNNYPVPAGGMAILINLNGGKMYFKSVNLNGVPSPVRTFDIKEKAMPIPTGADVVTRDEFRALQNQIAELAQMLKGGEKK